MVEDVLAHLEERLQRVVAVHLVQLLVAQQHQADVVGDGERRDIGRLVVVRGIRINKIDFHPGLTFDEFPDDVVVLLHILRHALLAWYELHIVMAAVDADDAILLTRG